MEIIDKDAATLTVEQAAKKCKRNKSQIFVAIRLNKLDWQVKMLVDRYGKIVVENDKLKAYVANCRRLDKMKEGRPGKERKAKVSEG